MNAMMMNNIKILSAEMIKGVLFEYYSLIRNMEVYERINKRLKEFVEKLNSAFLEEDYIIREK